MVQKVKVFSVVDGKVPPTIKIVKGKKFDVLGIVWGLVCFPLFVLCVGLIGLLCLFQEVCLWLLGERIGKNRKRKIVFI